ncbi:hypothetical protein XENORESO_020696 [Xenotaenia resolanae]|uniref:Uncharacterized protein n=1 Tax=Xenotaenia resolanae TaxID=208358 RepID=A0ABV0WBD9_9TELE
MFCEKKGKKQSCNVVYRRSILWFLYQFSGHNVAQEVNLEKSTDRQRSDAVSSSSVREHQGVFCRGSTAETSLQHAGLFMAARTLLSDSVRLLKMLILQTIYKNHGTGSFLGVCHFQ